jgi:hypothetical protein
LATALEKDTDRELTFSLDRIRRSHERAFEQGEQSKTRAGSAYQLAYSLDPLAGVDGDPAIQPLG